VQVIQANVDQRRCPKLVASQLVLKRASASRPSGEWNDEDFNVLADCVVGRIFKANAARSKLLDVDVDLPTPSSRSPMHGYAESQKAAMAAFAKAWRRE
jgi:hypothetical protein